MEFMLGVLGPTIVQMHGKPDVKLGPPKLRMMLGALLTSPGRRMGVDTLAEWVWQDNQPKDLRATLHQYVTRVRKALDGAGIPAVLKLEGHGCILHVESEKIDYKLFDHHMRNAWADRQRGDHSSARDNAHAALKLRRGDPLDDLRSDLADEWRTRWEQNCWIPANFFLVEELLAEGQPQAALRQLDDLDEDHPGQLLSATLRLRTLDAMKRRDDVTALYRSLIRRYEGDALAIEEVRSVWTDLRYPAAPKRVDGASVHTSRRSVLRQVPRRNPDFVGRDEILHALDEETRDPFGAARPTVVALAGLAAVGKTSIAIEWAHRAGHRYPDGVAVFDLHGLGRAPRREPSEVVDTLLRSLNYPVDHVVDPNQRAAELTRLLADRSLLVVLDNVADSDHVHPLLPVLSTCTVVLISRHRLTGAAVRHQVRTITVDPLPDVHSRALLVRGLGPRDAEPHVVDRLVELCCGIPLVLTLVADRAAARTGVTLGALAEWLANPSTLLALGDDGDGAGVSLRSAFELSYHALGPAEQRVFTAVGLQPDVEFGPHALAAAAGLPVVATERSIDTLVAAHLVQQPGDADRFGVHDLLHHYAALLAEAIPDRAGALSRLLSFFLHTAHNAHEAVHPYKLRPPMLPVEDGCAPLIFTDAAAAQRWCLTERTNLNALVEVAARHELHGYAWRIPALLADLLDTFGFYDDIVAGLRIAAESAAAAGDIEAEASMLNDLGQTHMLIGNDDEADRYLHAAYELVSRHRIEIGQLTVMLNMARRHLHAGRIGDAVYSYQETIKLARRVGEPDRLAATAHRLADALAEAGREPEALPLYREALEIRMDLGFVGGIVQTRTALAALLIEFGDYSEAAQHCEAALPLAPEAGLPANMKLHTVMARLAQARGSRADALEYARRAVELANEARNATGQARARSTLAEVLADQGDLAEARVEWTAAAALYRARKRHHRAKQVEARLRDHDSSDPALPTARRPNTPSVEHSL
ncbi:AfsR/SARP family transcriptional regulator [Amycolatopsis suaedae]|uniref:Tetratricopeptide repeat protein n=1 Tax=Amycolatopsis suaedae TaxID=2510978 RepID=A0A4Q7JDC6_9PSEU|nr:tetratricopeptide repeat protein [Amycolatopsis suaedae]RZQ64623.1 tetratricopeptide repeat protein [Amycolatopsis suaedae]